MAQSPGISETEMGTWIFRVVVAVIGVLLSILAKDAKKSLDLVPVLAKQLESIEKAQGAIFERLLDLERGQK
jgi:hypothetical protein